MARRQNASGSNTLSNCACGSNLNFDACCGPVIGGKLAETAEALLRARYTAFAMGNTDFFVETLTHAGRFPLAMVLPTLRQGARAYGVTASHGTYQAQERRSANFSHVLRGAGILLSGLGW